MGSEPFQIVEETNLDRIEDFLMNRSERAVFIPADAYFLANVSMHLIREIRSLRKPNRTAGETMTQIGQFSPQLQALIADISQDVVVEFDDVAWMTSSVKPEQVVERCYEANRRFCARIGDSVPPPFDEVGAPVREGMLKGVRYALTPGTTPEGQHEEWMKSRLADGWKFGETLDREARVHPNLRPYSELPEVQRAKDALFRMVVTRMAPRLARTETVYAGEADARQGTAPVLAEEHRLFRKRYRKLSEAEVALHDAIKAKAEELHALLMEVAPVHKGPVADREKGANVTLAVRHLEDCVYRGVKALTS